MIQPFLYAQATLPKGGVGEAIRRIRPMSWLVLAGGGSIGWASNDVVALLPPGFTEDLIDWPNGARDVQLERLTPTVRPVEPFTAVASEGVIALRWFELPAGDWEEFVDLSAGAWPSFEAGFGATILGLFRSADTVAPAARALLVTRYPSLAVWEQSRGGATAGEGDPLAEAGRRFRRRHQITSSTVVRIATPA